MDIGNIYDDGMEFYHKFAVLSVEKLKGSEDLIWWCLSSFILFHYWAPLLINLQFQLITNELPKCFLHWTGHFLCQLRKSKLFFNKGSQAGLLWIQQGME